MARPNVGDLIPIGAIGNAKKGDVLQSKTYSSDEGVDLVGTMPNRGKINNTITTQGGQIIIPQGYHNGSGVVKAQFANLVPENIKEGVNVGGVVGTHKGMIKYGSFTDPNWTPGKENTIDVGFAPDWVIAYSSYTPHNTIARYSGNIWGWSSERTVASSLQLSSNVYVVEIKLTSNGFIAIGGSGLSNKGYGSFVWLAVKA